MTLKGQLVIAPMEWELPTERDQWVELAKKYAGKPERTTLRGLCYAVMHINDPYDEMSFRLEQYVIKGEYAYENQYSATDADFLPNREARCLAALWLAEEAEDDARSR